MDRKQRTWITWGSSVGIHVVLLLLIAATGIFSEANHQPLETTDVAIYDVSGGDGEPAGGGGGSGDSAPAPEPEPAAEAADAITVPAEAVPEETAQKPQNEQKQPAANTASTAGTATQGSGSGEGGSGNGSGGGQGNGHGTGTGDGEGSGSGTGDGGGGTANPNSQVPATPPQLISRAQPAYPENLRKQNATGTVGVSFVVGADGSVTSASVDSSSGYPEMDAAALDAVYEYTFAPALNEAGKPVACRNHTNIHFALR